MARNDWRAIQEMTNHFWSRFVLEYMPDLTRRTKWFKDMKPIEMGDIVLVIRGSANFYIERLLVTETRIVFKSHFQIKKAKNRKIKCNVNEKKEKK